MSEADAATPTDRWLASVEGMPPLEGPAGVAERLILLLHYGIDWSNGWVANYRKTYWDQVLPDRLIVATYRADTLRRPGRAQVTLLLDDGPAVASLQEFLRRLVPRLSRDGISVGLEVTVPPAVPAG